MLLRTLIPTDKSTDGSARSLVLSSHSIGVERGDVFEGALLDKAMHRRTPTDWLISLLVHVAIVATLVIVPLFVTRAVDLSQYETTYLATPPTPFAPPPPPAPAAMHSAAQKPTIIVAKLTMPIAIPENVSVSHDEAVSTPDNVDDLSARVIGGIPGGVAGGVPGGVLGGILGGTGPAAPPLPPPAVPVPNAPLHVGGEVKEPLAISTPQPEYPRLARDARVEGSVQIDAVIDKNGNVVQARAVDGPPLLIAAALQAVEQWKYQPTYLNGVPWPVEFTVDVHFQLS